MAGRAEHISSWEIAGDDRIKVMASGESRFRLVEMLESDAPYMSAVVELWDDEAPEPQELSHLMRDLGDNFVDYLTLVMLLSGYSLPVGFFDLPTEPTALSFQVANSLQIDVVEKQRLLEEPSARERLLRELLLVRRERDFLQRLVSLHGVAGDLDMRWGLRMDARGGNVIGLIPRKDGSGGQ
jgi:Lon protease-like protein